MHIALLGGSFNPPHVGHLMAATYVHATRGVDEVWLVPAFRHPFAKALASFEHRTGMCEALCALGAPWLKVSRAERELEGQGFTVDLLAHLRRAHPAHRFTLVLGSDLLGELPKWKDFARIETLAQVLVLYRAGYPDARALGPPLVEVSSSEVHRRLAAGDRPDDLVPSAVLTYVREHGLYGA